LRDAGPADPSAPPPITFVATSLGRGRRTKFIEVVVEDRDGNRCATSQGTMIVGGSATLWSGYRGNRLREGGAVGGGVHNRRRRAGCVDPQ